jgi:hypothetical protein
MATKYLKHLNQFPATYLRDLAGNPSVEVKPGEMLVYTDIVNSDITSVNYNLNLWTDYVEKNNFTIITIPDPVPPPTPVPPPVITNTFLFYKTTTVYVGNSFVADGEYPFFDYSPDGSQYTQMGGAWENNQYPNYYNAEFLISVANPQSLAWTDNLGPHVIPASAFNYNASGNLLVNQIYMHSPGYITFDLTLLDTTVLQCFVQPPAQQ